MYSAKAFFKLLGLSARYHGPSNLSKPAGFAFAMSNMALAWFRPRGVVMNAAQPLFSSTIGRM
jgi:hypothetical protein